MGDFSAEVSVQTVRIISDDILFGEIIADQLEDNLDIADKLAQNTVDSINKGPMEEIVYTQQQIEATAVYRPSVRNINYPEFSAPMRKFRALFMLCWNTLKIILFKARKQRIRKIRNLKKQLF